MQELNQRDPGRIDPALRAKYDVRGPRYTSYPPATHFHEVDSAEVFERWRARNGLTDDPGLSFYFHIPFCRARCQFCGCHTHITRKPEKVTAYVDALVAEMKLAAGLVDPARPVRQVALGGGTPNFLTEEQIHQLLSAMEDTWSIAPGAELSVEIDPRTSTPGKLDAFLAHGFNRFSLGIQDFSPEVLKVIRRGQGLMQVADVVAHLRAAGCEAINFDLIYGLPRQTLESVAATADEVIGLKPSRIALYSYAHVPWIQPHQEVLERAGLPEPDLKAAFALAMQRRFAEAGYQFIGMDHYALPDDSLAVAARERSLRRNFMGYTTGRGLDLLAFGASSISSVGTAYSQDAKDLPGYHAGIEAGRLPIVRGFLLDDDDVIRRELLLDLFCNFRLDLQALGERFGIDAESYLADDLQRLGPMVDDGLVELGDGSIEVTDTGRFFIRNVCMTFDKYLEADSQARVYSRTV